MYHVPFTTTDLCCRVRKSYRMDCAIVVNCKIPIFWSLSWVKAPTVYKNTLTRILAAQQCSLLRETDHAGRINERMRRSHRHPQGSESQTKQKSVSRLGIELQPERWQWRRCPQ